MQSKLAQELYKQTKILIQENFPDALPYDSKHQSTGWRVWQLNQNQKLKLFLVLAPSPKDDCFDIEIAWTIHEKLPEFDGLHPDEDSGKGKMRFNLSRFWQRYGMSNCWYLGAVGSEAYNPRGLELPPELEHCSMASVLARPENKELAEKAKELGVNMIPPKAEPFEQKLASVKPQIEDAFARLKQHGIPYLKDVAGRYGVEFSAGT